MNKEEILAKSRKENQGYSEHDRLIGMQGANFSTGAMILMWFVLIRFTPLDLIGQTALGLLVNVTCLANFGHQWFKGKRVTAAIFSVLFTASSAFYLYQYLVQTNLWPF